MGHPRRILLTIFEVLPKVRLVLVKKKIIIKSSMNFKRNIFLERMM